MYTYIYIYIYVYICMYMYTSIYIYYCLVAKHCERPTVFPWAKKPSSAHISCHTDKNRYYTVSAAWGHVCHPAFWLRYS